MKEADDFIAYYDSSRPEERLGGLSTEAFRKENPEGTWPMVIQKVDRTGK